MAYDKGLPKAASGITGLDEITAGGLPRGRPTLICGGPGCGKTLFAIEFLVQGALQFGEPGVFVSFEETAEDLAMNVRSLGYDLEDLQARQLLVVDHVLIERSQIEETGDYDLEGLFVRLGFAIDSIGAKRVALDTIESLFAGLSNSGVLRAELRRLFAWLRSRGVTVVITGERGDGQLTRQGLEEYVSDCVILLDQRVSSQLATRRLRIVKYRGTSHDTNEFPFLIDPNGITIMPITTPSLDHAVSSERLSTGIADLDEMLSGGYFEGSSILIRGTAGSGKTSIAGFLTRAAVDAGHRALFFAFEEPPAQIIRNLQSIGCDLEPVMGRGVRIIAARPTAQGLEGHLASMYREIETFRPDVVVIDPISSFLSGGSDRDIWAMLMRLIDHLKGLAATLLMTTLTDDVDGSRSDPLVSSLVDTVLALRIEEHDHERDRRICVIKSRGMAHVTQVRSLFISADGVAIRPLERRKSTTAVNHRTAVGALGRREP